RAVMSDQPDRHSHGEAVKVELAARIAALHLLLQSPADILQLSVADLKTVSYLYPVRIMPQFFRHPVQQRRGHAQGEECVSPFRVPDAQRVRRDDVNIAWRRSAAVVVSRPVA